jgi:hypothetical protein
LDRDVVSAQHFERTVLDSGAAFHAGEKCGARALQPHLGLNSYFSRAGTYHGLSSRWGCTEGLFLLSSFLHFHVICVLLFFSRAFEPSHHIPTPPLRRSLPFHLTSLSLQPSIVVSPSRQRPMTAAIDLTSASPAPSNPLLSRPKTPSQNRFVPSSSTTKSSMYKR